MAPSENAVIEETQLTVASKPKRLKWTERMNSDLLECKRKAVILTSSRNPPTLCSGRKKGYMTVMKELWDDMGYAEIGLSSQNLRDQAARVERTLGNVKDTIRANVGCGKRERSRNIPNVKEKEETTSQNANL